MVNKGKYLLLFAMVCALLSACSSSPPTNEELTELVKNSPNDSSPLLIQGMTFKVNKFTTVQLAEVLPKESVYDIPFDKIKGVIDPDKLQASTRVYEQNMLFLKCIVTGSVIPLVKISGFRQEVPEEISLQQPTTMWLFATEVNDKWRIPFIIGIEKETM